MVAEGSLVLTGEFQTRERPYFKTQSVLYLMSNI